MQATTDQLGRSASRTVRKEQGISAIAKRARAARSPALDKASSTTEGPETLPAPPGAPALPAPPLRAPAGHAAPPPAARGRKRAFSKEMTPRALRAALKKPEAAELPDSTSPAGAVDGLARLYFGTQSRTDGRQAVVAALLAALVLAVTARECVQGATAGELSGLPAVIERALAARAQGGRTLAETIDRMHCHNVHISQDRPFKGLMEVLSGLAAPDAFRMIAFVVAFNSMGFLRFLQEVGGPPPASVEELVRLLRRAYDNRAQPFSIRHLPQLALRGPVLRVLAAPYSDDCAREYTRLCLQGDGAW
ncbi:unnamed protein product, partial [Prorocentrum cordatum]